MRKLLGVALVTLALGCSGGDDDNAESSAADETTTTTTTTVERTTTTAVVATVNQIASVVASVEPDMREALEEAEPCRVDYIVGGCDFADALGMTTAGIVADTLETVLGAADEDRPENRLFIGAIPAEIEDLVRETVAAAAALRDAGHAISGCDFTADDLACSAQHLNFFNAAHRLETQLDAWGPYI